MRRAVVSNRFYPGAKSELVATLNQLFPQDQTPSPQKAKAVVVPHAGYIYSGQLAAQTLARVVVPDTVVMLGPNHHGTGAKVALSTTTWQMPLADIPSASDLCDCLLTSDLILADEAAHSMEHSLEVMLPLLYHRNPKVHICPLSLSRISFADCQQLATDLARCISSSKNEVLILASSDMNHFAPQERNREKDLLALEQIAVYDPKELLQTVYTHNISMCGVIPVVIAMLAARQLGASTTELVGHTDSGQVSGDTSRVVGYAGIIIN